MDRHHDRDGHYVKRVVLPSGKTIEVVYFQDPDDRPGEHSLREVAAHDMQMHVCRSCGSHLVHPTGWEEAGDRSWRVCLRCPECEALRDGLFSERAVERFDEHLDAGTDELMADYRRLMRANMAQELERFSAALAADAIVPEDFQ